MIRKNHTNYLFILTVFTLITMTTKAVEQGSFEEKAKSYNWITKGDPDLPNVYVIGDSISIGYHLYVQAALKGIANIYRPMTPGEQWPENGGDTRKHKLRINKWLEGRSYSVIHFNSGLHDLKRPNRPDPINSLELYKKNLEEVIELMKSHENTKNATLIFGLTTPYPQGVTPTRVPEDASLYNDAAISVMTNKGIKITDLYNPIKDRLKELQIPINVHFNEAGSRTLGILVAQSILESLQKQNIVPADKQLSAVPQSIKKPRKQ